MTDIATMSNLNIFIQAGVILFVFIILFTIASRGEKRYKDSEEDLKYFV